MIRYLSWMSKFWPTKKRYEEINKLIEESQQVTHKADIALNRMMAALDGETKWFECRFIEKEEESNGRNNFNHRTP